ncbi:MAG: hypothetical protein KKE17_02525 [Proteobacteria bacterium]|nr:hypothetical protein [Pseudomonadota bacterium]MBU1708856.1 hypothetical protein [Pseudomonadota bacterium]
MGKITARFILGMAVIVLGLSGCALERPPAGGAVSIVTPDFFGIGEDIALQLAKNLRRPLGSEKRLIMTTMVNIDDLYQTSRFGRTLTESLATRMFNHGFGVVDVRKTSELLIRDDKGEFMLSRDAQLIAREHDAEAVVAGTYSLTPNSVIINVRMFDAGTQDVLSVAGLELQRSNNINDLLAASNGMSDAALSAYER